MGMRMGAGYPRQTTTCLLIFYSLQTKRATRKRRPLFHLQTRGLMLPAHCWKRSLQHSTCSGDANGSGFPTANSYFLLIFSFLRVERATRQRRPLLQHVKQQLRLPARCWKRSLQVSYPHVALRRGHISDSNPAPDCRWIVFCLRRYQATNAAIMCVDWRLQRVVVSAHLSFHSCDAFPTHGNTHLPRRATGPLWRPPSGRFFPSLRYI